MMHIFLSVDKDYLVFFVVFFLSTDLSVDRLAEALLSNQNGLNSTI